MVLLQEKPVRENRKPGSVIAYARLGRSTVRKGSAFPGKRFFSFFLRLSLRKEKVWLADGKP